MCGSEVEGALSTSKVLRALGEAWLRIPGAENVRPEALDSFRMVIHRTISRCTSSAFSRGHRLTTRPVRGAVRYKGIPLCVSSDLVAPGSAAAVQCYTGLKPVMWGASAAEGQTCGR